MKALPLVVWAACATLCATVLVGGLHVDSLPEDRVWITYAVSLVAITLGVVVWRKRPGAGPDSSWRPSLSQACSQTWTWSSQPPRSR